MALTLQEEKILESIVVRSANDPKNPEFPADNPKFPATPTYQIQVPGFSDVWLKDESHNPTGTHKDRMAWEIVIAYKHFLTAKKNGQTSGPVPSMSIISFGSAASAIQTQFKKYGLPNLKVLIDFKLDAKIKESLEAIGCELFETDLSHKAYTWKEILALTNNPNGFDITSNEALDPTTTFYDWLSYEVINSSPEYCFIPFGTGNLYENVLNTNKKEIASSTHDPRFSGDIEKLRSCNFIGATTNNPNSKADKLYSPHLPFVHYDEQWIRFYRAEGFCGSKSDVMIVKESFLGDAMKIASDQKITAEPSGIAGLALLLQIRNQIPPDAKILIINTGKSLNDRR